MGKIMIKQLLRVMVTILVTIVIIISAFSCFYVKRMPLNEHIVPAPISSRANIIITNLITECGTTQGVWVNEVSSGCTTIWATQFGLRAGLRRNRDDIIQIGRVTADYQYSRTVKSVISSIFGGDFDSELLNGTPALLVSGMIDGSRNHMGLFLKILNKGIPEIEHLNLDTRERCGLVVILAELYRLDPDKFGDKLELARILSLKIGTIPEDQYLKSLALSAIALASRNEKDIESARKTLETALPNFDEVQSRFNFPNGIPQILSSHLAFTQALVNMAKLTKEDYYYKRAHALLDYVFSDTFFNGKFLVHDLDSNGKKDWAFCSGCNFYALYLLDALYGDSWVIEPLPELPNRKVLTSDILESIPNIYKFSFKEACQKQEDGSIIARFTQTVSIPGGIGFDITDIDFHFKVFFDRITNDDLFKYKSINAIWSMKYEYGQSRGAGELILPYGSVVSGHCGEIGIGISPKIMRSSFYEIRQKLPYTCDVTLVIKEESIK
ncbi:MAG: hypothetical protein V1709_10650 [Planctomycetota bacterium]